MWKMAALAFRRWTGKVTPLLHNDHTTEPPLISESKQMFGTFTGYWTKCQSETWEKINNKCSHFRAEIITASLWELAINKSKATEGTKQITKKGCEIDVGLTLENVYRLVFVSKKIQTGSCVYFFLQKTTWLQCGGGENNYDYSCGKWNHPSLLTTSTYPQVYLNYRLRI